MSEHLANSSARLENLLTQIMKEKDPLKYDTLCAALWRVLGERESFIGVESTQSAKCVSDLPRGLECIGKA